jgi:hypothetical protein
VTSGWACRTTGASGWIAVAPDAEHTDAVDGCVRQRWTSDRARALIEGLSTIGEHVVLADAPTGSATGRS